MLRNLGMVLLSIALLLPAGATIAATVNINTADADALAKHIIGVGPRRADAIINYRKSHGPFKNAQELTKVKGIGQKLVTKNLAKIVVSDNYSRLKDDTDNSLKVR